MLITILTGTFIALSFSAPPGPVAMETIRRGLRGGFGAALQVQLGSVVGDVAWCVLAVVGLAPLVQIAWVRVVLTVAGVGVLLYLGATGIREAMASQPSKTAAGPVAGRHGAFGSGLAISMANPMAVGYWLSVGGALVAAGVAGSTLPQTAAFMSGFIGGTIAWCFIMALAVRWSSVVLTPRVFRWVTLGCSAALLVFGMSLAVRVFGSLL